MPRSFNAVAFTVIFGSVVMASAALAQDSDADLVPNTTDNCRFDWNPAQSDLDGDAEGDACDSNLDGDAFSNTVDACPFLDSFVTDPDCAARGLPAAGFPLNLEGVDATQPLLLWFDTDLLPARPELVFDFEPAGIDIDVDIQLLCNGADFSSLTDEQFFGPPFLLKTDPSGGVVSDPTQNCSGATPAVGIWTAPLFLPIVEGAFGNGADLTSLNCFLAVHYFGPALPGNAYDVSVDARTQTPIARSGEFCSLGCDASIGSASSDTGGDYGCFVPDGANFSFLDAGDPAVGQCAYVDPNPSGQSAAIDYNIVASDRWDCCVWQYEQDGIPSGLGFSNFWTGAAAPDPRPDGDLDGILDRCDNCAAIANAVQRDTDEDGAGDFCDLCPSDTNPANSDVIPAGDACQCSDIDSDSSTTAADLARMLRFIAGAPLTPPFDSARCRISGGLDPVFLDQCTATGIDGVRQLLALGQMPVEACE